MGEELLRAHISNCCCDYYLDCCCWCLLSLSLSFLLLLWLLLLFMQLLCDARNRSCCSASRLLIDFFVPWVQSTAFSSKFNYTNVSVHTLVQIKNSLILTTRFWRRGKVGGCCLIFYIKTGGRCKISKFEVFLCKVICSFKQCIAFVNCIRHYMICNLCINPRNYWTTILTHVSLVTEL